MRPADLKGYVVIAGTVTVRLAPIKCADGGASKAAKAWLETLAWAYQGALPAPVATAAGPKRILTVLEAFELNVKSPDRTLTDKGFSTDRMRLSKLAPAAVVLFPGADILLKALPAPADYLLLVKAPAALLCLLVVLGPLAPEIRRRPRLWIGAGVMLIAAYSVACSLLLYHNPKVQAPGDNVVVVPDLRPGRAARFRLPAGGPVRRQSRGPHPGFSATA